MTQRIQRRVAVFAGQFDPITNGHLDIIRRGVGLFDELIVGVGINPDKQEMFSQAERVAMIRVLLQETEGIKVEKYTGLTVDFAKKMQASVLLRGIRDVSDLRNEFHLAQANRALGGVETVFIMTGDQYALTSSSLIRQVIVMGGNIRQLSGHLPELVLDRLESRQKEFLATEPRPGDADPE
jgi:pantetheine-phosphate adenylyltransferase